MSYISVFDILKIGIGPSSSHTLGPWQAARRFVKRLNESVDFTHIEAIRIDLYGSLALTGKGHGTDIAIIMGLNDLDPETVPVDDVKLIPEKVKEEKLLHLAKKRSLSFQWENDITFHFNEQLPYHPNGMKLTALNNSGETLLDEIYYSIGGGFVLREDEMSSPNEEATQPVPYDITCADDVETFAMAKRWSIARVAIENEFHLRERDAVNSRLDKIIHEMKQCIYRGCHTKGLLPGGLQVRRRSFDMHEKLLKEEFKYDNAEEWLAGIQMIRPPFDEMLNWISCFAMSVNEENANFGRVVTAPTNGAAGVIPAVLAYYVCFSGKKPSQEEQRNFLLIASVIGGLFKNGATISAAMGGCQAEIGVSSAMAAAALTECMGGNVAQSLMAAEIAMEHHLGLTCDPVKGLVQVPCIERNTMGAIKAITASNLALASDPDKARVSLDEVIKTMWQTAQDMNLKYKETSLGGLATNIAVIVPEC